MAKFFYWNFQGPASDIPFDPKLRKATTMMKMVVEGLKSLSHSVPGPLVPPHSVPTFLGSMHGEIEPTLNYLKGLAQMDRPRPFLFQNSLHHSTTGFASQQFQWIGPSYSLCCIRDPQPEILRAGLLQVKDGEPLLLIHAESFPAELAAISNYSSDDVCEILFVDADAAKVLRRRQMLGSFAAVDEFLKSQEIECDLP